MIDTDKMRAAFAATPLCQNKWTEKDGDQPTKLCALSSLVSFAGVQPDLIAKLDQTVRMPTCAGIGSTSLLVVPQWVAVLALPVLRAEYGIPEHVATQFPDIFDKQENEWRGVEEVLALCERYNMDELHVEALAEDAQRFPRPALTLTLDVSHFDFNALQVFTQKCFVSAFDNTFDPADKQPVCEPKAKKPAASKFWTAPKSPAVLGMKVNIVER